MHSIACALLISRSTFSLLENYLAEFVPPQKERLISNSPAPPLHRGSRPLILRTLLRGGGEKATWGWDLLRPPSPRLHPKTGSRWGSYPFDQKSHLHAASSKVFQRCARPPPCLTLPASWEPSLQPNAYPDPPSPNPSHVFTPGLHNRECALN